MRKFVIAAAAASLVGGASLATAQEHHDQHAPPHAGGGAPPHPAPHVAPPHPAAHITLPPHGGPQNFHANNPPPRNFRANNNPAPQHQAPVNNAVRGAGSGQRHDFTRVQNFHRNFNATRRFHIGAYRPPQGYYAHHWAWGETLPPAFWVRDYWITDFADYALLPPPYGAVWVRVGPDALLIDQDSGDIIEVDYGVFY